MEESRDSKKAVPKSSAYFRAAVIIYVVGVIAAVIVVALVPEAQRTMMVGVAMGAFVGGGMKLLQMLQAHETSQKVSEDLDTTKTVAYALNGGFDQRVQGIVRNVLATDLPAALAKALAQRSTPPSPLSPQALLSPPSLSPRTRQSVTPATLPPSPPTLKPAP